MTTTNVPQDINDIREAMAAETGSPLGDIGSAPNAAHKASGGYHCGAADLAAINAVGNDDYSIRQTRDRNRYNADRSAGRNDASAIDYPDNWPRGGRAGWIRFNNLLRQQLGARDPALGAIRGINFTPDGTAKRRFDCVTGNESSSTDTVDIHTHIELWRDTIGQPHRRWAKDRLVAIAHAAITNTPLDTAPDLPEEDDMINFPTPFSDAANNTAAGSPLFFGTPGQTCTWVGSKGAPTPGLDSIRALVSGKWVEEWFASTAPPTGAGHSAGAAPGVHRSMIHILGALPPGYEDCAAYPAPDNSAAIVAGVLQGLANDPSSDVTQADIDGIMAALAANPDAVRQEFRDHPIS